MLATATPCRNLPTTGLLTFDVVMVIAVIGICTVILIFFVAARR